MHNLTNAADMDRVCAGLRTKSDKIRALATAGAAKGEIARYLDIRYQFVYNVLKGRSVENLPQADSESRPTLNEPEVDEGPLTIPEAKRRLAKTLGVDPSNIKITIEG